MELNEFEKDLIYDALKSYRWAVVQKDLQSDQYYNYRRLLVIEQLLDKLDPYLQKIVTEFTEICNGRIGHGTRVSTLTYLFENYTFEDGTPFGIKEK